MSVKTRLPAVLAILATLAVMLWHGTGPAGHALPSVNVQAPVSKLATASPEVASRPQAATGSTRSWLDTLEKYNTARSYRAFLYEARRSRPEGATVYAIEALNACLDAVLPGVDLKDARQRAAMASLRKRCDMSYDELSAAGEALSSDRHLRSSDRLFNIAEAIKQAKTPAAQREAIDALLATQDPAALGELGMPAGNRQMPTRHFMGQEYEWEEGSPFAYALRLAQCDLGLDCGPEAPPTLQLCIRDNWCAASYRDALQLGLADGTPSRFAQVEALAADLVAQIRKQNSAAFVAKK